MRMAHAAEQNARRIKAPASVWDYGNRHRNWVFVHTANHNYQQWIYRVATDEIAVAIDVLGGEISDDTGAIDAEKSRNFNWSGLVKRSFRKEFPEVNGMLDQHGLGELLSANAAMICGCRSRMPASSQMVQ